MFSLDVSRNAVTGLGTGMGLGTGTGNWELETHTLTQASAARPREVRKRTARTVHPTVHPVGGTESPKTRGLKTEAQNGGVSCHRKPPFHNLRAAGGDHEPRIRSDAAVETFVNLHRAGHATVVMKGAATDRMGRGSRELPDSTSRWMHRDRPLFQTLIGRTEDSAKPQLCKRDAAGARQIASAGRIENQQRAHPRG